MLEQKAIISSNTVSINKRLRRWQLLIWIGNKPLSSPFKIFSLDSFSGWDLCSLFNRAWAGVLMVFLSEISWSFSFISLKLSVKNKEGFHVLLWLMLCSNSHWKNYSPWTLSFMGVLQGMLTHIFSVTGREGLWCWLDLKLDWGMSGWTWTNALSWEENVPLNAVTTVEERMEGEDLVRSCLLPNLILDGTGCPSLSHVIWEIVPVESIDFFFFLFLCFLLLFGMFWGADIHSAWETPVEGCTTKLCPLLGTDSCSLLGLIFAGATSSQ